MNLSLLLSHPSFICKYVYASNITDDRATHLIKVRNIFLLLVKGKGKREVLPLEYMRIASLWHKENIYWTDTTPSAIHALIIKFDLHSAVQKIILTPLTDGVYEAEVNWPRSQRYGRIWIPTQSSGFSPVIFLEDPGEWFPFPHSRVQLRFWAPSVSSVRGMW